MAGESSESWLGAVTAVLELTASGRPDLLAFQLETILNSPMRFAVYELASSFGVSYEQMELVLRKACADVDTLEKRRGRWSDLESVLESPNVSAIYQVCKARSSRVSGLERRRLEGVLRKLKKVRDQARDRAWIETFIERPQTGSKPASRDRPTRGKSI